MNDLNTMSSVIKELLPMREASDIEEAFFDKDENRIVGTTSMQIYFSDDSLKIMVKDMKTYTAYICNGLDFLYDCCKVALGEKQ
jgi:hypothetical protein